MEEFLTWCNCRYAMYFALFMVIVQNIELIRMVRVGPFSFFDVVATFLAAQKLASFSTVWYFGKWSALIFLFVLGEALHHVAGQCTPFQKLICHSCY